MKLSLRATCTAIALSSLAAGLAISAPAPQDHEPTPGSMKFPEALFDTYLIAIGYDSAVFRQNFTYGIGGTSIQRLKAERAQAGVPWQTLRSAESTAYYITGVAVREGGDELWIAGLKDDGTCLIERWSYAPRPGGWRVTVPVPQGVTLGTALAPTAPVLEVAGGGAWQPPPVTVQQLPAATRREVWTTPHGPLHGLDVDPEGRYVVFFDMGLQQLLQLNLTQNPVAAAPIPGVNVDQVASVELWSFDGEGRKCVLTREYAAGYSAAAEVHTLLADPDNDGVFGAPATYDQTQWLASPYADFSRWDLYWWR